jgi:hypothetical protein
MGEKRNAYRWERDNEEDQDVDNIKMYVGEMGWGDVDWIGLAKDRKTGGELL